MHNKRLFIVPLALGSLLLIAMLGGVASAAPGDHGKGQGQDHASVMAFWTADRIASAQPREVIPHGRFGIAETQKPGGTKGKPGGGDSGGSSSTVTGASWTGGGAVKQQEGKVLFVMGENAYVCSGTVVLDTRENESMVLTAGHCVFDESTGEFATNWIFVPNYEEVLNFGCNVMHASCWSAAALVTSDGWANGGGSLSGFNEDYGFAIVGANTAGLLENQTGASPIAFTGSPSSVYAFGYPHAYPYDGNDLVYCAGSAVADGWGGTTSSGLDCNMTGGSSGGGWFESFDPATGTGTLVSVNSFKYTRGPYSKYMFGPRFDSDTAATYQAANDAVLDEGADNNVIQ